MSLGGWALRSLWLLTTPVAIFRGWQVSSVAVGPVLERIGVALTVSILPVFVIMTTVEARRRGTLGERLIVPWWGVVAISLLGFPILFGAMSFAYDRPHGHGAIAATVMTLIWLAPHAVALSGLTMSPSPAPPHETQAELATVDVEEVPAEMPVLSPSIPAAMPQYRPGTAPDHLRTDWQLGQQGLRPGGPPRAWLLLDHGPGMYLYDENEANER